MVTLRCFGHGNGTWAVCAPVSLIVLVAGWSGCEYRRSVPQHTIEMACDVSPGSRRAVAMSDVRLTNGGRPAITTTSSEDATISDTRLTSLLSEIALRTPIIICILPSSDGEWVTYIAHNLQNERIRMTFKSESPVSINGREQQDGIVLKEGAHGFRVALEGSEVSIEHVYLAPASSAGGTDEFPRRTLLDEGT